jgi:hypothetical protein
MPPGSQAALMTFFETASRRKKAQLVSVLKMMRRANITKRG